MSMQLLQYPLKPHELPDDLESFVYVIVEGAARFHLHDLSDVPGYFATLVSGFFEACSGTGVYRTGGRQKLIAINSGPPIQSYSRILSDLLYGLYDLLKQQWESVDRAKLEEYRAPKKTPAVDPQVSVARRSQKSIAAALEALNEGGRFTFEIDVFEEVPQEPLPSPSVELSQPLPDQPGILSNHRMMGSVIASALANFQEATEDKVDDQYTNLSKNTSVLPTRTSRSQPLSAYVTLYTTASTLVVDPPPSPEAAQTQNDANLPPPASPIQTGPQSKKLKRKRLDDDDDEVDTEQKGRGKRAKNTRGAGRQSKTVAKKSGGGRKH